MEGKNGFHYPEEIRLFFINSTCQFPLAEKKNKRTLFQLNRKLGMENLFKKTFLLEGKVLPLTGITKK